jgi:antitoxin ParD1/3/4
MTNSLPPDLSAFVNQSIATGKYASPDEVVVAGLRLLQEQAREVEELRKKLQEGIDALDRGDYTAINSETELEEFFQDIRRRGIERLNLKS